MTPGTAPTPAPRYTTTNEESQNRARKSREVRDGPREVHTWFSAGADTLELECFIPSLLSRLDHHPLARRLEDRVNQDGRRIGSLYELPLGALSLATVARSRPWAGLFPRGRGGKRRGVVPTNFSAAEPVGAS
jgi:hypothetical protein